jgi:Ca-activated chloride channel homolog
MQKQTLYVLGVSTLIFLSACTQNNDSNNNPDSQTLNSESQPVIFESIAVIPEVSSKEDDGVAKSPEENETRIEFVDKTVMAVEKDQFAGSAALGAVGGYRSIQPETKYKSRRMIVSHDSLLQNIRQASELTNRESYAHFDDNPVKLVTENPVSTFSIDVDTGAYSNVRRMLQSGSLPTHDAVRVEEMINYFSYDYPASEEKNAPFIVMKEIARSPWNKNNYLLHLGVKAHDVTQKQLPNANLVFLIDVSGSMQSANKLELLKTSLKLLSKQLSEKDKVSIVVYAGASGIVLNPTAGNKTATIQTALSQLTAGGSTNGAAGIELAYNLAQQEYIQGGINRVIIATDGDFNVGTVNHEQLMSLIEEKRKSGISLSTLGFGTGNYNDQLMEQLADKGNGNYAYIDNLNEAKKVLVDEMSSTLLTVAKDVKIQIEFNPDVVSEYRLIGYENRHLKREDFNNDKIDAGEIGAGHTVTALYEITLADSDAGLIDPLRYQKESGVQKDVLEKALTDEIAFLRLRYKMPKEETSQLLEWPVSRNEIVDNLSNTSDSFRFSAAVAGFAQKLRGGKYLGEFSYQDIMTLAQNSRNKDMFGYRGEFLSLVNLARSISVVASKDEPRSIDAAL